MKIILPFLFCSTTLAFAPPQLGARLYGAAVFAADIDGGDFGSAMPSPQDEYTRFGVTKDKVAVGVNMNELLQFVGTKEAIIERIESDNKWIDRERAVEEVDKLLMDVELMSKIIFYEKNKDEIALRDMQAASEQNLSDPSTIGTYALWLIGGASIPYIRKNIINPKFESGEWSEFHINLDNLLPFLAPKEEAASAAAPAVEAVQSAVESASDVISSTSDIISSVM